MFPMEYFRKNAACTPAGRRIGPATRPSLLPRAVFRAGSPAPSRQPRLLPPLPRKWRADSGGGAGSAGGTGGARRPYAGRLPAGVSNALERIPRAAFAPRPVNGRVPF